MNTYTIGTRYQIRTPRLSLKRFGDAQKMIRRLGDPAYDNVSKSWAGTCEDAQDRENLYFLGTTYACDIAAVRDDDERAELLAELARVNARRREILTVLGAEGAEAEQS